MSYIDKLIQAKKYIIRDTKDNLDIVYITTRILAMSYPFQFDTEISNNIDEISRFLYERYQNNYRIYNLTNIKYDDNKFNNNVYQFEWSEHYYCDISQILQICFNMEQYLSASDSNVVVINCLDGKGRSGVIISSFLLYLNRFEQINEAIDYYNRKRFNLIKSLREQSQIRCVQYFDYIIKNQIKYDPPIKYIKQISISEVPVISLNKNYRPFIEIYNLMNKELLYTSQLHHQKQRVIKLNDKMFNNNTTIDILKIIPIVGDVMIKIMHNGKNKNKLIARFCFNTQFIQNNILRMSLQEMDPHKIHEDSRFSKNFQIITDFEDFNSSYDLGKIKEQSQIISRILMSRKKHEKQIVQKLLFFDPVFDDCDNYQNLNYKIDDNKMDDEDNQEIQSKICK